MVSNCTKLMVLVLRSFVVLSAHARHADASESRRKHDASCVWLQVREVACDDCKVHTGYLLG